MLLLDGFDEVPRQHHGVLVREIERLAAAGNQILLTCRSVSLPRGLFASDFRIFECIGFSLPQQRRFLRQWFSDSIELASRLEHQINTHTGVLGFARNPLLLSLMAVVAENEPDFALPVHRTALYEKALRTLLERRSDLGRSQLSVRRKLSILRTIASATFLQGQEILVEDALLDEIASALGDQRQVDPESVLHDFVEVDGVLATHAPQKYRFLHLTFQEFLTAQSLIELGRHQFVIANSVDEPRWEETIRLTCGLLPRDQATALIKGIWTNQPGIKGVERLFLAARAASDCVDLDPDLPKSLAVALIHATAGSERPGQINEAEEALAFLSRTHEGLSEKIVAVAANPPSGAPLLSIGSFVRILGMTGDNYSAAALRSIWTQLNKPGADVDEHSLDLRGRVLSAIGQAGLDDLSPSIVEALSSPSNYIRAAAAGTLIELQAISDHKSLLRRLHLGQEDQQILTLSVLCSFHDQALTSKLFATVFKEHSKALQRAFAFHFNRSEMEIDPSLVGAILNEISDPFSLSNVFSMQRCFLNPLLFSRLRGAAFADDIDVSPRSAAIMTLLRLDSESIPDLLQIAIDALSNGHAELFRAILAAVPGAKAEAVGRSVTVDLTEEQRKQEAAAILRFALSHRVASLREWSENLSKVGELAPSLAWRCLLTLAALGSPVFLDRASQTVMDLSEAKIPERIIAYRGLGLMTKKGAKEILLSRLEAESDQAIVTEIIHALSRHVDDHDISMLLRLLHPSRWPKNWPPAEGPRRQGDQRPSDRRRLSVIFALEQSMNDEAVPHLMAIAADSGEDAPLREAAMIASRNILWGSGATAE